MNGDCPFCDYAGPSPMLAPESWRVDRGVIVFEPLNPVTPGHVIVVPVEHVESASDDAALTGRVFEAAARWARVGDEPFNLITSAGAEATQTVKHLHVHVVPRRAGDGLLLPWSEGVPGRWLTAQECEQVAASLILAGSMLPLPMDSQARRDVEAALALLAAAQPGGET